MWPVFYILIDMFHFNRDVSEERREKIFEKNISKYLNILSS